MSAIEAGFDDERNGDVTPTIRTSCESGSVGVLLGNRDGSFKPAVAYGSGGYTKLKWIPISTQLVKLGGSGRPSSERQRFSKFR
jgi:hypothetical protein